MGFGQVWVPARWVQVPSRKPSRPEVLKLRALDQKHQHFGNLLVVQGLGSSPDLLNQKFCVLVCPRLNVWEPRIWFSTRHLAQCFTWSLSRRPGLALMWVEKNSFAFNLRLKEEAAQWPILFPLPVTYTQGPMTFQSWKANLLVQTHIHICTHTHSVFLPPVLKSTETGVNGEGPELADKGLFRFRELYFRKWDSWITHHRNSSIL